MTGFDGLKLNADAAVPQIGDKDVLVKCESTKKGEDHYQPVNINYGRTIANHPQSTPHPSTTATWPSSMASTPSL